jgi:hypothetical protein
MSSSNGADAPMSGNLRKMVHGHQLTFLQNGAPAPSSFESFVMVLVNQHSSTLWYGAHEPTYLLTPTQCMSTIVDQIVIQGV